MNRSSLLFLIMVNIIFIWVIIFINIFFIINIIDLMRAFFLQNYIKII